MNWDVARFLVVLGECKDFEEAQLALLNEGVRQLEIYHANLALRTYDPTDVDIALLRVKETQKELDTQIEQLQTVIESLQGGPHGPNKAEDTSRSNRRGRVTPRSEPAALSRTQRPADADRWPGDPTGRYAAPPWRADTPGTFSTDPGQ